MKKSKPHAIHIPTHNNHHVIKISHFGGSNSVYRMPVPPLFRNEEQTNHHLILHDLQDEDSSNLTAFHHKIIPYLYRDHKNGKYGSQISLLNEKLESSFSYKHTEVRLARQSLGDALDAGEINFSQEILSSLFDLRYEFFSAIENHDRSDINAIILSQIHGLLKVLSTVRASIDPSSIPIDFNADSSLRFTKAKQGKDIALNILQEIHFLLNHRYIKYGPQGRSV